MASWITHTMIADLLFERYSDLDERGFCVGNIAPDCNMPNSDWSAFIPSREITHFMDGEDKLSARYDVFFDTYIKDRAFINHEEYSFLLGYYAHLITDVEYLRFCRDSEQLHRMFERIRKHPSMAEKIKGKDENFTSLKDAFGKNGVFSDIFAMENAYLQKYPNCSYNRILRNVRDFPNYLDFFPQNYYGEKITTMLASYDKRRFTKGSRGYFFQKSEYENYLIHTTEIIFEKLEQNLTILV